MSTDSEIIRRVLSGELEAFGELAGKYQGPMFAVALSRVRDYQDAEDICQEAFLRAYRSLPNLKKTDAFAGYLFSILRRLCSDFLRGKWSIEKRTQLLEELGPAYQPSVDPRPSQKAAERADLLWSVVSGLDIRSRDITVLYYGQGLCVREIAELENLSQSAVRMRLKKARQVLGRRLVRLKEAWAAVPAPALSARVTKTVQALGPLKSVAMLPAGLMFFSSLGSAFFWRWLLGRDVERWRGVLPQSLLSSQKRLIWLATLFFSAYLAAILLLQYWGLSKLFAMIPFLVLPLFGAYIGLRDIFAFMPRRAQIKNMLFSAYVAFFLIVVLMKLWPDSRPVLFGMLFILQGFVTDKESFPFPYAPLPTLAWLRSFLKADASASSESGQVDREKIRPWLSMLWRAGIVMGPLCCSGTTVTVSLALSSPWGRLFPWRPQSKLKVGPSGEVKCQIAPLQYIRLSDFMGQPSIPARRDLEKQLAVAFGNSLAAFQKSDTAALRAIYYPDIPVSATRTNIYRLMKYVIPALGVILLIFGLMDWLK
jgi:RNA polymerase sigma factor (sigma-70 family)